MLGLSLTLALFSLQGCVQRDFSKPVLAVYDVRCPASKIHVLSHQYLNGEELWVLDVCGVPLELEEGLELPTQWRELVSDPGELEGLKSRLRWASFGIDEAAREKAEAWCKLNSPSDPSEISFNSSNAAEFAECRRRMRAIRTLGVEVEQTEPSERTEPPEPAEQSGPPTYWFSLGQWLLMAPFTFHRPACSRLQVMNPPDCYCPDGDSPSSACAEAERARSARAATLKLGPRSIGNAGAKASRTRTEPEPRSVFYVRGGLGVGFLSSTGGDMEAQSSGSFSSHISLGFMAMPALALGASVQTQRAFNDYKGTAGADYVDIPLSLGSIQAFASYYFLAGPAFLHVDAFGGVSKVSRVHIPRSWEYGESVRADGSGPSLGLGAGIESFGSGLLIGLRISATQAWTSKAGAEFSTLGTNLTLDLGYY